MRKALIAVIVASALFAVGAFAASFTVQSEDIASGSNPVDTCAESAVVDFTEDFDETNNNWQITAAVVTFTQGSAPASCAGREATLVLQSNATGEPVVYEGTITVPADGAPVDVSFEPACSGLATGTTSVSCGSWAGTHLPVSSVWNSAILIDGIPV